MRKESQKRADKVRAKKLRRIPLDFNVEDPQEKARLDHLEEQSNKTAYIKKLIDQDIEQKTYMNEYDEQCEQRGIAG